MHQVRMYSLVLLLLSVAAFAFYGCTGAGLSRGDPHLSIEAQQAVLSPTFLGVASIFIRIGNTGPGNDVLLSASVDMQNAVVELHDTEDGKMVKIDRLKVPSGKTVALEPGGPHVMVFGLPKDMPEGSVLNLSLKFEKSGVRVVPVRLVRERGRDPHWRH